MHNVVSFLYYTAGSCIFNDDLDSILYVPLLIVYSVGSGVVGPKLCNFGNLKLRWRLHQSHNSGGGATAKGNHANFCSTALSILCIRIVFISFQLTEIRFCFLHVARSAPNERRRTERRRRRQSVKSKWMRSNSKR